MLNGIVFICNKNLELEQYIYNSFNDIKRVDIGDFFGKMCDIQEENKVGQFGNQLKSEGVIFDWELNVLFSNSIKPLRFSGSKINDSYFIFALETNNDVPSLYEELVRINNEQSNYIRTILKDQFMSAPQGSDIGTLEELTKLNNELANLQRELTKKNIELQKLNDLKNHFLGMAAHDLRNPLSHIYNFSELLEEELNDITETQKHFLSIIKKQSLFMVNLVSELLDFSAIESGKVTLNLQKVDLIDLITDNIKLNYDLAEKKSIQIDFINAQQQCLVKVDPEKINQVLSNLITNAIKYSNECTKITIELVDEENKVQISVIDQGLGISEEFIGKLFKPFQVTSNNSTGGEKSTGLGLFITKRIVESHKGKIWVKSEKNKGSEFIFTLNKFNNNN